MAATSYLNFSGLNAPVALEDAAELMPVIQEICGAWPFEEKAVSDSPPFVTIRQDGNGSWAMTVEEAPSRTRVWNTVNLVCDLVSEMAWERLRSDPSLLCLHAAAVNFSGHLVVFPNTRRSGKSTLTAALAQLEFEVYTDDFLPVGTNARQGGSTGQFYGIASGIAPRVRLPLPEDFKPDFKTRIEDDPGPNNSQYKYLLDCATAREGEALPLGAVVILDRQDRPCPMSLDPVTVDDAVSTLVGQNFARVLHSGTILRSVETIAMHVPAYCLTYHNAEAAAAYLASHDALQAPVASCYSSVQPEVRLAPLGSNNRVNAGFDASSCYAQTQGITETVAGDTRFLADANGTAIYRLNAMSGAIWSLLEHPIDLAGIVEILTAAFEDAAPDQVAADCEGFLKQLVSAGLISDVAVAAGPA